MRNGADDDYRREAAPRFDKLTMRGENRLEAVREQATVAALARRC